MARLLANRGADGDDALFGADILARVSPEQKLELIRRYQARGAIVAMTGDGVNDAPALKKADIGVAMGLHGTEVAREAADMVLKDDAFGTIVEAVKQGRIIFDTIRVFVLYLLSCNLSEILVIGTASALGAPMPLLPRSRSCSSTWSPTCSRRSRWGPARAPPTSSRGARATRRSRSWPPATGAASPATPC